jgi:hypothetical protein
MKKILFLLLLTIPLLSIAQNKVIIKAPGGGGSGVSSGRGVNVAGGYASIDSLAYIQYLGFYVGTLDAGAINVTSISGQLTTGSQPNITGVGTLAGISVTGFSNLQGGFALKHRSISTTSDVLATDCFIDCGTGSFSITLPIASSLREGQVFFIKNNGPGIITIYTYGGSIDTGASKTVTGGNGLIIFNAGGYYVTLN